jgi:uncharacterized damage-inducible protein DinB
MTLSYLKRLFEHLDWADRACAAALAAAPGAGEPALKTYAHIVGAELVWLDRLAGAPQSVAVWPEADLAACLGLAETARLRFASLVAPLREPDLDRPVAYTNSAGRAFTSRAGDILLHVALHGAYHRGQIAQLLRQAGAEPAATDYIGFVRGVPAATERDAPLR